MKSYCNQCGHTGWKYWIVKHAWGFYHICDDEEEEIKQ